jgi:aspartate ammonia-lyase
VDAAQADIRLGTDLVGRREVRATARYGVHSLRATENFARPRAQRLSDVPEFCGALGIVKLAAQRANLASGSLDPGVANAIGTAAEDLIADRQRRPVLHRGGQPHPGTRRGEQCPS